jgi:electron transfer flavoprotein alpha subunit
MSTILAVGEIVDGHATRLTLELATVAQSLAQATGGTARVVVSGGDAQEAAAVAAHGPSVLHAPSSATDTPAAAAVAAIVMDRLSSDAPDIVLIGASPDGKDVAGTLVGLTELPILVAGTGVEAADGSVTVDMATFGGRLLTRSEFSHGGGIVLLRPGSAIAVEAATPGNVETIESVDGVVPAVRVIDRVEEAAAGASIDDARVIIGGGRGVGSAEGFGLLSELAEVLDGAVGASRAAVDNGWIDFAQQIGQTGKTVKPELYLACGISGAIQHKVGIQSASTIVSINTDRDAPISEFADLVVIGDLLEIVPRVVTALRERDS